MREFFRHLSSKRWPLMTIATALILFHAGPLSLRAAPQQAVPVPTINANQGTCSADFVVKDGEQKPIYNATIDVTFHYGFLNLHKESLEVHTNSDGKARFEGLPNFIKKPLEFRVQYGDRHKTVTDDPAVTCSAIESVILP